MGATAVGLIEPAAVCLGRRFDRARSHLAVPCRSRVALPDLPAADADRSARPPGASADARCIHRERPDRDRLVRRWRAGRRRAHAHSTGFRTSGGGYCPIIAVFGARIAARAPSRPHRARHVPRRHHGRRLRSSRPGERPVRVPQQPNRPFVLASPPPGIPPRRRPQRRRLAHVATRRPN